MALKANRQQHATTEQAGGMIIVAGPVYHPEWSVDGPIHVSTIGFYPLSFSNRPMLFEEGAGGNVAWPLEFTPEARRAEFRS